MFENLSKDKTVLYTTHRLSNISFANKIIVIENGIVTETGTKEDLLKNQKKFAQLYQYYMNGL